VKLVYTRVMRNLRVLLLPVLLSCAGGDSSDGGITADAAPDAAALSGCVVTLAGDVTGTLPCSVTAGKRDEDDFSIVAGMSSQGSETVTQVVFSLRVGGELAVRDHAASELDPAAVMMTTTDGRTFAASSGLGAGQGTIGPLAITGLELTASDGGVRVWAPSGSFTATLAGTSAGGTVMMSVAF
jgi:hypothetical protein